MAKDLVSHKVFFLHSIISKVPIGLLLNLNPHKVPSNRIKVKEEKSSKECGYCLNPELFNGSSDKNIR